MTCGPYLKDKSVMYDSLLLKLSTPSMEQCFTVVIAL